MESTPSETRFDESMTSILQQEIVETWAETLSCADRDSTVDRAISGLSLVMTSINYVL